VKYDANATRVCLWGGIERYHALKNNINDIQLYYQNDMRFLEQFYRDYADYTINEDQLQLA
jgi:hypothetical protein